MAASPSVVCWLRLSLEEEESDVLDMEDFEPNDLPRAQERRKLMLCTEYAKVMCGLWRVRPVAFVVMRASVFGVLELRLAEGHDVRARSGVRGGFGI